MTDSKDNTALHRAAWYGEVEICEAMIAFAKTTGQLDELKKKRNNNMVGATQQAETILDNISHLENDFFSAADKVKLQKLMGTESKFQTLTGDTLLQECKRNPACLNHHDPKYWNTLLMQMLRLVRDAKTMQEKQNLRQQIHQLLENYWEEIDFTESNLNGDTALHSAIWYGEHEIARKIIVYAGQKSADHRVAVLAARNTQGQTKTQGSDGVVSLSGGEVPHMNLAARGSTDFAAFEKKYQDVAELIFTFLILAPELLQEGDSLDVLLDKIITRISIELSLLTAENENKLLEAEQLALFEVLWASQQLKSWKELCAQVKSALTPTQATELNGLLQMYGKQLEGYSSMNFLQSSPLVQLKKLIDSCDADKVNFSPAALSLKKALIALRDHGSLQVVESAL
ncbi:MAG: hypothetical protein ACRCXC_00540 [Legionella sp.]